MRFSNSLALLAVALTMGASSVAHAQAYQCRMPQVSRVPQITPNSSRRELPVTGYTMALSWSPAFCRTRQDSRAHKTQCSGDNGRFGLVVHGL
ncbi:MAG: ribonuclease T, partial [Pseudomonadota bacterium]